MKNFEVTIITIVLIVTCHFGGVFGVVFWFGGLFIIPALAMLFQYRYLSGSTVEKIALAAMP
ncbi:hypothetical protein ACJJIK_04540 [Microbulbifer sp. ZKSA006]|uniref:hypothetical protein n=1 Tax=Microbulbifer sp. ZKSA006 TaxID=3243390 RepID=UPI0040395199